MEYSEKIFESIFYLLFIPLFRLIFNFLSKKASPFLKEKNIPLFNYFILFFKFYSYYFVPFAVLFIILNKWL